MSADPKKRAPAKLGDVLASVLQQAGLTDRVAQAAVIPEWPTLVGAQIATVTEPLLLQQDGTLVVMVKTHAWMQELTFLEPELLRSLVPALVRRCHSRVAAGLHCLWLCRPLSQRPLQCLPRKSTFHDQYAHSTTRRALLLIRSLRLASPKEAVFWSPTSLVVSFAVNWTRLLEGLTKKALR